MKRRGVSRCCGLSFGLSGVGGVKIWTDGDCLERLYMLTFVLHFSPLHVVVFFYFSGRGLVRELASQDSAAGRLKTTLTTEKPSNR